MNQLTETRLIFGALLLGAAVLSGCDGNSRPFEEAVEVQNLNLQRVDISPPASEGDGPVEINRGQRVQMSLTGNSVVQLDPDVDTSIALSSSNRTWSSSNTNVLSVNEDGVVTGRNDGNAMVKIAVGGLESSFPILVQDAVLTSIDKVVEIDGNNVIERCIPEDYYAIGNFSDSTDRPVYDATFTLSEDSQGTVEMVGSNARVSATSGSAMTLFASAEGVEQFTFPITVDNTLATDGIAISPSPVTIDEEESRDLVATGTYTAGESSEEAERKVDITDSVQWQMLTGGDNAKVESSGDNKGRLTGEEEGVAVVMASCGDDVSTEANVTVTIVDPADSDNLTFSIGNTTTNAAVVGIGETKTLIVRRGANYDNGVPVNINDVRFATTNTPQLVNSIDLDQLEEGIIEGSIVGTTTVVVTLPGDDDDDATGTFTVTVEE